MKKSLFIAVMVLALLPACGRKGPLKPPPPPPDLTPGISGFSATRAEKSILLKGTADEGVASYEIERMEGVAGSKKVTAKKTVFSGREKELAFTDTDISYGNWYLYRVLTRLKSEKPGKAAISPQLDYYYIPPAPRDLSYEIDRNKAAIRLRYEGGNCPEFRVYKQQKGKAGASKPYSVTDRSEFVDELPSPNTEILYRVSCVEKGMESVGNPSFVFVYKEEGVVEKIDVNNVAIVLKVGDITDQDTEALVNAANPTLLGGGGVDGAIHAKGGPKILEECKKIGGCDTGKAVITTGGNLKAKYVIHTVGPVWRGGKRSEEIALASAYYNSLMLARDKGIKSISFPSISTGAYGFPVEKAARIALSNIIQFAKEKGGFTEIRVILFRDADLAVYHKALGELSN